MGMRMLLRLISVPVVLSAGVLGLSGCSDVTSGVPGSGGTNAVEVAALRAVAEDLDSQMQDVATSQGVPLDADIVEEGLSHYPSSGGGWAIGDATVERSGSSFQLTAPNGALCYIPSASSSFVDGDC